MSVADPYAAQLASFTSSIPNARRGLIDLYKLRRRNIEGHYNQMGQLYGSASATSAKQYAASRAALGGFASDAMGMVGETGANLSSPDARAAVKGIVAEGTSPFNAFLKTEGGAVGALYRGRKGAEQYEDRTLKTGLARERPAALSELEQGIIDTQTNLQGQSSAYQQAQQFQNQQASYMQQMLQMQGQAATSAQAGAGGGLSGAEQWIIGKESSNNVYADNPTSTAFGLGQLLIGNRQRYGRELGFDPNTTDYGQQLAMMRAYIQDRYGSAEQAMAFWQSHGWY